MWRDPAPDERGLHKERTVSAPEVIIAKNPWRLEKFRTCTILAEEHGKKAIYKCAATEKAKPFIKNIPEIEKANSEYLRGQFDVLHGLLQGEQIKYDYLTYPSLEEEIASRMREGRFDKANELFEKYIDKIRSLQIIKTIPKEFLKVFVNDSVDYYFKTNCLTRGLLDLTPHNIYVNGDRWIVIDNEWSFDFPIPIVFLLFRTVKELSTTLQPEIRKNTREQNPAMGIFARNLRTFYVPLAWAKYITHANITFRQLLRWEYGFHKYVTGFSYGGAGGRIKLRIKTRTNFPSRKKPGGDRYMFKLVELLKKFPCMRQIGHILDRLMFYWRK